MSNGTPALPTVVYGTFAGAIDQSSVNRWFNTASIASNSGVKHVHILFQSSGGTVPDGICLFNFFRSLPIELSLYNVGSVGSIATVAYLGAKHRYVSASATFLLHRTQGTAQAASSDRLHAIAQSVSMDDARTEGILLRELEMPPKLWKIHKMADLWLTAKQAIDFKLATDIGDFAPPFGANIFNI
jgi:ATP-dependent Clp protease protease subunit